MAAWCCFQPTRPFCFPSSPTMLPPLITPAGSRNPASEVQVACPQGVDVSDRSDDQDTNDLAKCVMACVQHMEQNGLGKDKARTRLVPSTLLGCPNSTGSCPRVSRRPFCPHTSFSLLFLRVRLSGPWVFLASTFAVVPQPKPFWFSVEPPLPQSRPLSACPARHSMSRALSQLARQKAAAMEVQGGSGLPQGPTPCRSLVSAAPPPCSCNLHGVACCSGDGSLRRGTWGAPRSHLRQCQRPLLLQGPEAGALADAPLPLLPLRPPCLFSPSRSVDVHMDATHHLTHPGPLWRWKPHAAPPGRALRDPTRKPHQLWGCVLVQVVPPASFSLADMIML